MIFCLFQAQEMAGIMGQLADLITRVTILEQLVKHIQGRYNGDIPGWCLGVGGTFPYIFFFFEFQGT